MVLSPKVVLLLSVSNLIKDLRRILLSLAAEASLEGCKARADSDFHRPSQGSQSAPQVGCGLGKDPPSPRTRGAQRRVLLVTRLF